MHSKVSSFDADPNTLIDEENDKAKIPKRPKNTKKIEDFGVARVNQQLRLAGSRVKIFERGNKLSIRGIFPPRFANDGVDKANSLGILLVNPCSQPKELWTQQKFSTSKPNNPTNLKYIASFCVEITHRLNQHTFEWDWFYSILGKSTARVVNNSVNSANSGNGDTKATQSSTQLPTNLSSGTQYSKDTTSYVGNVGLNQLSIGSIQSSHSIFPSEFSKIVALIKDDRVNGNKILEDTWHREYYKPYCHYIQWCLDNNHLINTQSIAEYLITIPQNQRKRKRYYTSLKFLIDYLHLPTQYINEAGIPCNISRLSSTYELSEVDPESLPPDEKFIEDAYWVKKNHADWYHLYCYLLLYGLRNTELQVMDYDRYPNVFIRKSKNSKQRYVMPFKLEWVDLLKIDNQIRLPTVNRTTRYGFSHAVTTFFRESGLSYTPLMMRHRFARCMAEHKVDPFIASMMMGHSLQVHQTTYMKFVGLDSYYKSLGIN